MADTETPVLAVEALVGGYGGDDILRGMTLNVSNGSITTVIGPNGAGKSTLLRAIFGMLKIRAGSVRLRGRELVGESSRRILTSGVAFVPQGRCNFPLMTVHENLEMGAFSRRGSAALDIDAVYEEFPVLKEKQRTNAGYLSGGQQQILEMAMALVVRPSVLLIDEPSLGLSPKTLAQVFEKIEAIRANGVTVLMVEQNARQALGISDRGIVVELGRNAFDGEAKNLLDDPRVRELYLGG